MVVLWVPGGVVTVPWVPGGVVVVPWVPGRCGHCMLPAVGGRCCPPSICVLAAERGTVTRLFLTVWGGWRGLVPPWLYH